MFTYEDLIMLNIIFVFNVCHETLKTKVMLVISTIGYILISLYFFLYLIYVSL